MNATTPVGGFGAAWLPNGTTSYRGGEGGGDDDAGTAVTVAAERRQKDTDLVPPLPPPQQERQKMPDMVAKTDAAVLAGRAATAGAAVVDPYYGIAAELSAMDGGATSGRESAADHEGCRQREESLRWKLETERRDTRRRLEAMKGEVERVVGQFRTRAVRAEAAAASAEKRAAVKALRYLRSKRPPSPVPLR